MLEVTCFHRPKVKNRSNEFQHLQLGDGAVYGHSYDGTHYHNTIGIKISVDKLLFIDAWGTSTSTKGHYRNKPAQVIEYSHVDLAFYAPPPVSNTVFGKAYRIVSAVVSNSFESPTMPSKNQYRFNQLNVGEAFIIPEDHIDDYEPEFYIKVTSEWAFRYSLDYQDDLILHCPNVSRIDHNKMTFPIPYSINDVFATQTWGYLNNRHELID